jgi:hypothetical protein
VFEYEYVHTWSLMDHRRTVPSSEPDRKRCGSVAEKSTDQMRLVCSANAATCSSVQRFWRSTPQYISCAENQPFLRCAGTPEAYCHKMQPFIDEAILDSSQSIHGCDELQATVINQGALCCTLARLCSWTHCNSRR